jgi:cytochrome c5
MRQRHLLVAVALSVVLMPLLPALQAQSQAALQAFTQTGKKQTSAAHGLEQHQGEGERIFEQNCSRCHTAPESFSPRISGTIVRHMRVRASLSQHDEQELLRFLSP